MALARAGVWKKTRHSCLQRSLGVTEGEGESEDEGKGEDKDEGEGESDGRERGKVGRER